MMQGQCNKLGHSKERCHWNVDNPNNKLIDKKEVTMNGNLTQTSGGTRNKSKNKGVMKKQINLVPSSTMFHLQFC